MISSKRAYDLVWGALRDTGMVGLGDDLDDNMAQEVLLLLNGIRAEWSLNVRNYALFDRTFQAPENRASISMGTGGDITVRPADITQVVVYQAAPPLGVAIPLGAPLPYESYRNRPLTEIFAIPEQCFVDTNFPLQRLYFFPGLTVGYWVRVQGMAYMTEYEHLSDGFMDPPEWWEPLRMALALRAAPRYGVELPAGLVMQYQSALKHIKSHMFAARLKPMPLGGLGSERGTTINMLSGL